MMTLLRGVRTFILLTAQILRDLDPSLLGIVVACVATTVALIFHARRAIGSAFLAMCPWFGTLAISSVVGIAATVCITVHSVFNALAVLANSRTFAQNLMTLINFFKLDGDMIAVAQQRAAADLMGEGVNAAKTIVRSFIPGWAAGVDQYLLT